MPTGRACADRLAYSPCTCTLVLMGTTVCVSVMSRGSGLTACTALEHFWAMLASTMILRAGGSH